MRGIAFILLTTVLMAAPANAENFLDQLGRGLDRLGKNLGRELEGALKQRLNRQNRSAGVCVTYNGQGMKTDEQRCVQEITCPSQQRCVLVHLWPSGLKTIVDVSRGRQPVLNGRNAYHSSIGRIFCVTSLVTTNRFCFVKPEDGRAPRIVEAFNPGGTQPQDDRNLKNGVPVDQADSSRWRQTETGSPSSTLDLMDKIMTVEEVDEFFDDLTPKQLAPVNAFNRCEAHLLAYAVKVANPVPLRARTRARQVCAIGAERYGQRFVREYSNQRIATMKAKPTTLDGLRDNRWFRLDGSFPGFTAQQQRQILQRYEGGIQAHRNAAVANAKAEIAKAFRSATPLAESGNVAWRLCNLKDQPPVELVQTCNQQRDQFNQRVQAARCDRAIATSGASKDLLDMSLFALGVRSKPLSVRKVICAGVNKNPNYRITVDSGFLPLVSSPSLQIYEGQDVKLLDVELRVASERDGRSFGKLLLDIATGENERDVPEFLVVERIAYARKGLKWNDDRAVIGCALNLVRCQ